MNSSRHWLVEFFRWDIRAVLATALGLVILIGITLAATEASLVAQFDFGGVSVADRAVGMIQVKGSLSPYPQTSGNLKFGWTTADITEFSDKAVSDLMKRDYNSGPSDSIFKITGLEEGIYTLKATIGSPSNKLSTRMQVGSQATTMTVASGSWQIATLAVLAESGTLEIKFSSANGADPWGVCGLMISTGGSITTVQAGFAVTVSPTQQNIKAGNIATFSIGATPLNNYGSGVTARISGLITGMTAEFAPAELAELPGVVELRLYTAASVPPTVYTLLITLQGQDSEATKKTTTVKLTVTSEDGTYQPVTVTPDGSRDISLDQVVPDLPARTPKEIKEDFVKVDEFVAEQQVKLLQRNNFSEMKGISDSLSQVPVLESLPQPKTTTELILQKLVGAGIISSTSDNAPAVQSTPPPAGFWKGLWQIIFKPAQ